MSTPYLAQAIILLTLLNPIIGDSSCRHESTPILSKCTGCPPKYNGKLCASTTRYTDLTRGACGCGTDSNTKNFWTKSTYTAALNCMYLDETNPTNSWCPKNCGKCFNLCATGGTTSGKIPSSSSSSQCITVQITNRCGDGYNNSAQAQWCRQQMTPSQCELNPSECANMLNTNDYGYSAHFDLQNVNGQIDALGWDNVEVTFEEVDCTQDTFGNWEDTCYCTAADSGSLSVSSAFTMEDETVSVDVNHAIGWVIGFTLGSIVVVFVIGVLCFCFIRHQKRNAVIVEKVEDEEVIEEDTIVEEIELEMDNEIFKIPDCDGQTGKEDDYHKGSHTYQ